MLLFRVRIWKDKRLEKVAQFYNQITKENVIAQKQKIHQEEKKVVAENIQIINTDWLGEVPTFQEASNPFASFQDVIHAPMD